MERDKNEIWSGAYKALTVGDVLRIDRLNARNNWGISYATAERLFSEHRKAYKCGDIRKMEQVEYRLTERAESLYPCLSALCDWAVENFEAIMRERGKAAE